MNSSSKSSGRPHSTFQRWFVRVSLGLSLVCVVTAIICLWLWRSEPAFVARTHNLLQSRSPQELQALAVSLQNRIPSELSHIGLPPDMAEAVGVAYQGDSGTLFISVEEINAWLATELQPWLDNQGIDLPSQFSQPLVAIEHDELVLALRYTSEKLDQLFTFHFAVVLAEAGPATLRLARVRGGKLPLPVGTVRRMLSDEKPTPIVAKLLDGLQFDPVIKFDARTFRLVDVVLADKGVEITVHAE